MLLFWFLLLSGIVLVVLGVWGGPSPSRSKGGEDRRGDGEEASDPWEILMEPLPHEEELIKLPEHRPWYVPGRDRRYLQGLLMGLGAGLMVAGLVVLRVPAAPVDEPPQLAQEPGGSSLSGIEAPDTGEQGSVAQPPAKPEPATVLFTVEEGEYPDSIAARLREAGLIEDENAFLTRLTDLGVDTSLYPGTFEIPTKATLDEVIAALTK